eukprot:s6151_g2.t2
MDAGTRGRSSEPSRPAATREERERIALEARQHLRSLGAADLYHRVEPAVYGSAHAQVTSAFGGVEPPSLPAGPSASSGGRTGRGDLGQPASSRETSRPVAAASAPVAEDPEEGATLAGPGAWGLGPGAWGLEPESSFLSPFDPETESLEEYMRCDSTKVWRWPVLTAGTRRFLLQSAVSEKRSSGQPFRGFRGSPRCAARHQQLHVLRAIGAGISKLMQMPGSDPVAIYYLYKGAAEAYSEAGGTDSTGRVQARLLSLREKAENALDARSLPPSSAGSVRSSHDWLWENCGLVSPSKFRRRGPDEDSLPQPDFLLLGGGAYGTSLITGRSADYGRRLRDTLKGTRRRCYDTIVKESKHNGDYEAKPSAVFDRVVAALDASFHESDEAKAMKARAKYDNLETAFQEFQVSWLEALTELNAAGVYKCQKDLLYDYLPLRKIGSFLREEVSRDLRFWPLRPSPGVQQEFRSVENWSEAALVAREITLRKDANKALETHHTSAASACNLCAAVGIKDGSHRSRHHTLAAPDQYATGGGNANANKDNGKGKGKGGGKGGGQGKGGGSSSAGERPACRLFAQGPCTYGDKSKFAHVKDSSNQQEATQTLSAKEKKAARKKEKKEKAKGGGSNAEEKVYPLFEIAAGSSGGDGAVVYDSAHLLAYWPSRRGGNGGFGLARCQSCPQSSGSPRPRGSQALMRKRRLLAQAWNSSRS